MRSTIWKCHKECKFAMFFKKDNFLRNFIVICLELFLAKTETKISHYPMLEAITLWSLCNNCVLGELIISRNLHLFLVPLNEFQCADHTVIGMLMCLVLMQHSYDHWTSELIFNCECIPTLQQRLRTPNAFH